MHICRVDVTNFRGIAKGSFVLSPQCVFVGPNGCGKSTLVDALALALGRGRLVRLTEHDFTGSTPGRADRFRIVVSMTGFASEDPARLPEWFREGRAVPTWIDATGETHPQPGPDRTLCAQFGVVGRFDYEELEVKTKRYFYDADDADSADPFLSDGVVEEVPDRLLSQAGFFVLLSRRTWEGMVSFNSELFRRTLLEAAGYPSDEVIDQRDALRDPKRPIESSPALGGLVSNINERLSKLMTAAPQLKLRLTSGDSEGILHSLQPHYSSGASCLPVSRQGVGLLSLQSFLLLLEVATSRKKKGECVILALEEPELHLAPGLSARLVSEARCVADQVICTTHSPRVAGLFSATDVRIMTSTKEGPSAHALLREPLGVDARNVDRKLYFLNRNRLVESVMQPFVLVPEGRFDCEWLARLAAVGEETQELAPFGTVFGVAPTENAAVTRTAEAILSVRRGVVAVVDGDSQGDTYVEELRALDAPPDAILQWPANKMIEDVVVWILSADEGTVLAALQADLSCKWAFSNLAELLKLLKLENDTRKNVVGMKEDTIAHDAIIGAIRGSKLCLDRCGLLLDALVAVATGVPHSAVQVPSGDAPLRRFTIS